MLVSTLAMVLRSEVTSAKHVDNAADRTTSDAARYVPSAHRNMKSIISM